MRPVLYNQSQIKYRHPGLWNGPFTEWICSDKALLLKIGQLKMRTGAVFAANLEGSKFNPEITTVSFMNSWQPSSQPFDSIILSCHNIKYRIDINLARFEARTTNDQAPKFCRVWELEGVNKYLMREGSWQNILDFFKGK